MRSATPVLVLGLYCLEYYNMHFPTAGMVLSVVFQARMFEKVLYLDNFSRVFKLAIQPNSLVWFFSYIGGIVVIALNTRYDFFPRNSSLKVIKFVACSFLMNYALFDPWNQHHVLYYLASRFYEYMAFHWNLSAPRFSQSGLESNRKAPGQNVDICLQH